MDHRLLIDALGWLGVLGGYWMTWIQFARARRVGIEGISLETWLFFLFMGVFWVAYGAAIHNYIMVSGSLPLLPLQLALVLQLEPRRHLKTVVFSFSVIFLLSFVTSMVWGWKAGVLGTTCAMFWNRLPQIIELIRDPDVRGVSISSWLIGAGCSALWVAYYVGVKNWFAMFATAVAVLGNLTIVLLAWWRQRQQRASETLADASISTATLQ